ncbi:MAG TPA: hypothetical protein VK488_03210 [Gaiellaceae bacterium]|nr:hypothetical protein [Gaiellaceae bacterium]
MRKFLLSLAPAVFLVVLVLVAGAATSVASNPARGADIYGVGAGQRSGPVGGETRFDLSAHKGANGHPDFGHVAATNDIGNFDVYVDVDCVNAFGFVGIKGGAWISGVVRRVSPVPNVLLVDVGDRLTFLVGDGGEPSSQPVDAFYFEVGETLSCDAIPPPVTLPPNVTRGNINIDLG